MENRVHRLRSALRNTRLALKRLEKRKEELERKYKLILIEIVKEVNRDNV